MHFRAPLFKIHSLVCGTLYCRSKGKNKNTVGTFKSNQISIDEMLIYEERCEYFLLKLSNNLDLIRKKILWKTEQKIFTNVSKNSHLIKGNLATAECSYGIFPQYGRIPNCNVEFSEWEFHLFFWIFLAFTIIKKKLILPSISYCAEEGLASCHMAGCLLKQAGLKSVH